MIDWFIQTLLMGRTITVMDGVFSRKGNCFAFTQGNHTITTTDVHLLIPCFEGIQEAYNLTAEEIFWKDLSR